MLLLINMIIKNTLLRGSHTREFIRYEVGRRQSREEHERLDRSGSSRRWYEGHSVSRWQATALGAQDGEAILSARLALRTCQQLCG